MALCASFARAVEPSTNSELDSNAESDFAPYHTLVTLSFCLSHFGPFFLLLLFSLSTQIVSLSPFSHLSARSECVTTTTRTQQKRQHERTRRRRNAQNEGRRETSPHQESIRRLHTAVEDARRERKRTMSRNALRTLRLAMSGRGRVVARFKAS